MSHQRAAVEKLSRVKIGALYMDMGTGKTRTALELAVQRIHAGKVDCILWLCPVSVKETIAAEVEKHLFGAVVEMVRPHKIRNWQADIYIAGIESLSGSHRLNVRLMELVSRRRCFLVCDESSLIKNYFADRTLSSWRLAEQCQYKLILNGTPLSNNERDLYSQWYFLDWRILGYSSFYTFAANHLEYDTDIPGRIIAAHDTDLLVRKMQPYLYQVRKDECLDLPPKTYSTYACYMTRKQREEYERAKDEIILSWNPNDTDTTAVYRMFTALQRVVSGLTYEGEPLFTLEKNPRLRELARVIDEIPDDEKIIIWCKYTHEIQDIAGMLDGVSLFYGDIPQKRRQEELEKFRNENRFLVANKNCGAFGLNLQFCRYAIYYDNDFSWATRSQSEDRIHRAGQKNKVQYIDIICDNSIDVRIHKCLSKKDNLVSSFRKRIHDLRNKTDLRKWIDGQEIGKAVNS